MQESASFWTDIKELEAQLARSPGSFCFAKLSEVYLKVGLIDDALHVARLGVSKNPRYLAGQRALSLACYAKGLNDEARVALLRVTEAFPEDVPSQKLLGRLLAEAGEQEAACQAFRTVLEFAPDDAESRIELEALERSAGATYPASEPDDEEVIEDLEILEEIDVLEDDQPESQWQSWNVPSEPDGAAGTLHDPLSTSTLAELYVRQGFVHKALEIYRCILDDNPADPVIAARVAELEVLDAASAVPATDTDDTVEEDAAGVKSVFSMPVEAFLPETVPEALPGPDNFFGLENQQTFADIAGPERSISPLSLKGSADNALAILDGWLENIGRIKSCR